MMFPVYFFASNPYMNSSLKKWLQVSFFNLLLVATFGMVMRYKIAYSLPWIDQRNLEQAHSHFAFAGWLTQALMSLMVAYLFNNGMPGSFRKYRPVLLTNLITAYGMLFSFPFMGYKPVSIAFSTLSIFSSYWFAVQYWMDLKRLKFHSVTHQWFKAAVLFNAIASLGAFSLAYMLATKNIHPNTYLASIYFFLHFQYNGWFFFACMGLLTYRLLKYGANEHTLRKVYISFLIACLPAYFLSALWLNIPAFVYYLIIVAVLFQLLGWWIMLRIINKLSVDIKKHFPPFAKTLFLLFCVALTIKLLLQAVSVIPSLSQFAFGFRPIVIGYLHLVLLGVISIFIFSYTIGYSLVPVRPAFKTGVVTFVAGIIINEGLLMVQGISDMSYQPLNILNRLLLVAALILFSGILLINLGQFFSRYEQTHKIRSGQ